MPYLTLFGDRRIEDVARFIQPATAIFPMGAVPELAQWGTGPWERYLTHEDMGVDIWSVGLLTHVIYFIALGEPTTLTVSVKLVRDCDRRRHRALLRCCSPRRRECTGFRCPCCAVTFD